MPADTPTKFHAKSNKAKAQRIYPDHYSNAWVSIFSIMMFFISFFMAYVMKGHDIGTTFVRSVIMLVVTNLIARFLVVMWQVIIPRDQWLLIVHGPPEVDSRTTRKQKALERLLELEEEERQRADAIDNEQLIIDN